ncbi:MAG: zinc ribbon domain-containing protein [Saccharofermentanales bacterium]
MAIIKCPACGNRISDKAATCPNCGEPTKKKPPILAFIVLAFVVFYFIASSTNDTESSDILESTTTSHKSENKEEKWVENLEYALLKNKANEIVRCKSKQLQRSYIMCSYYVGDYHRKALFYIEGDGVVAVNGTAMELTGYSDIRAHDNDKDGDINIPSIIRSF